MPDPCEIVVYVRSRMQPYAVREIRALIPLAATWTAPAYHPVRRFEVRYVRRLDADQEDVLAKVRRIASETGNALRLVDLGRMNLVVRAVRTRLLGDRALPIVVMKGSCPWGRLGGGLPVRARVRA